MTAPTSSSAFPAGPSSLGAGPGPAPGSVEHTNLLSFLRTTRTLTLLWVLLGGLVALVNLLSIFFAIFTLRFQGGGLGGLLYAALWVGVDLLILERMAGWTAHLNAGRYLALKEPLLLWGVLGLIFGVVPGILLLLVYLRILPWTDTLNPYAGATTGPTGASGPGPVQGAPQPAGTSPSGPSKL